VVSGSVNFVVDDTMQNIFGKSHTKVYWNAVGFLYDVGYSDWAHRTEKGLFVRYSRISGKSYKNIYTIVDLFHSVMKAFRITFRINFILFVLSCSG
jgi:hypothetical protein